MTPMQAIQSVFGNYANFNGRARTSEYWWFGLSLDVLIFAFAFAAVVFSEVLFVLIALFALAVFLPALAVTARRLHDTNRSGWWILINLIPYLGGLVLLVLCVFPGTSGTNRYGPPQT